MLPRTAICIYAYHNVNDSERKEGRFAQRYETMRQQRSCIQSICLSPNDEFPVYPKKVDRANQGLRRKHYKSEGRGLRGTLAGFWESEIYLKISTSGNVHFSKSKVLQETTKHII